MATTLIENLRKTSECDVMFAKQRRQTLHVAVFNPSYVFYIVFVKHIKCCIVPHIIVQMGLPVDGFIPPKQDSFARIAAKHEQCSGSQLSIASSAGYTLKN